VRDDIGATDFVLEYDGKVLSFSPVATQQYDNCTIEAGKVEGHDDDNVYIRITKDGKDLAFNLLKQDEGLAVIWVLACTLNNMENEK
jgi:hypothetical protein